MPGRESVSVGETHHRPTPLETLLSQGLFTAIQESDSLHFLHSCRARRALITRHRTRVAFGCGVRRALARQLFKSSAAPASAVRSDGGGGGGPTLPRAALSDGPTPNWMIGGWAFRLGRCPFVRFILHGWRHGLLRRCRPQPVRTSSRGRGHARRRSRRILRRVPRQRVLQKRQTEKVRSTGLNTKKPKTKRLTRKQHTNEHRFDEFLALEREVAARKAAAEAATSSSKR